MRERLRQSAQIKRVVDRFWTAVDMIKDPDSGKVTRDSYIELNVKLQKAMISDFDEDVAYRDARIDWDKDIIGRKRARGEEGADAASAATTCTMSFVDFNDSMFELVDLW